MQYIKQKFMILLVASLALANDCPFVEGDEIQEYYLMPGRGYHIIKGSPLAHEDEGLMGAHVFKIPEKHKTYKSTKLVEGCPQWAWTYPDSDNWFFIRDDGVSGAQTAEAINSEKSYQDESGTHIEESASGVTPQGLSLKFTASQDFEEARREFSKSNTVMLRTSREATAFKTSVNFLNEEVEPAYYNTLLIGYLSGNLVDFIGIYGTHFMQEIVGGSRLEFITMYEAHDYQLATSNSASFEAGLEAWYGEVTAGVKAKNSREQQESNYVKSVASSFKFLCRGGDSNCQIAQGEDNDQDTLNAFWNLAYRFPAIMHAKLYPHDVFVAGRSTADKRRWNELQDHLDMHFADFGLLATQTLDRDLFLNLWKEALESFCVETTSLNGKTNSCNPSDQALPAHVHINYERSKKYDWGTENHIYNDAYYPPTSWIAEDVLKSESNWLQVMQIQMRCYKKQPMMLKFVLGDYVSPSREYHVVGQEDATSECTYKNDCGSDGYDVTFAKGYSYFCGFLGVNLCDWCCKPRGDGDMKLITTNLERNDVISGLEIQQKTVDSDKRTQITQLVFKIIRGSNPLAPAEKFGCEGDAPGDVIPPVYFDWRHYRLLNYKGSTTWYGQIASIEFKLYNLAGAGEAVHWQALHSNRDSELRACITRIRHTEPEFYPADKWNNKSGDEVCELLGLKGCEQVVDWNCNLSSCSTIATQTRAVGCKKEFQADPTRLRRRTAEHSSSLRDANIGLRLMELGSELLA